MSCYVNGTFTSKGNATLSPFDLGFLRGLGMFDTLRTYNRRPLFLEQRLSRFEKGAAELGITLKEERKNLPGIIHSLIENTPEEELIIRIIATLGDTEDGFTPSGKSTLLILTSPFHAEEWETTTPIDTITIKAARVCPQVKTLNYLPAAKALHNSKGVEEALYVNEKGELLEGTRSNFFALKEGKLITASKEIYQGFTRHLLLEKATSDMTVEFRAPHVDEIHTFEEAFLTASLRGIVPVGTIDGKSIHGKQIGPKTKELKQLLRQVFFELALN